MKCPECGYVSFDELEACKKCGTSFDEPRESPSGEEAGGRLQDELFSLRMNDAEANGDHVIVDADESPPRDEPKGSVTEDPGEARAPEGELSAVSEAFVILSEAEPEPRTFPPGEKEEADGREALPEDVGPLLPGGEDGEAVSAQGFAVPNLEIDFDPAGVEGEEEEEASFPPENREPGPPRREPLPALEDDDFLPENLWVQEGAGFFPRFLAFAFDSLVIAGVLALFFGAALVVLGGEAGGLAGIGTAEGLSALFVPFYLLGLFLSLSYFTFFMGWIGKTPGKALLKLDVRRTDGGPMTYSRAFLRWVGYLVSVTFAGLGFLWVFFDERKRGWHDYLSGTWVKNLRHE